MRDVMAAYLHPGWQEQSFARSLAGVAQTSKRMHNEVMAQQAMAGNVFAARNDLTKRFLKSSAQWLWMIDSDMGFAEDTLDRLIATAEREERLLVGALCFSWPIVKDDGMGGYLNRPQPTIYGHDGQGFIAVKDYERDSVVQAAATGAACLLIRRQVFVDIREVYGDVWWTPVIDGQSDQWLGEDLSFFLRANAIGHRLIVDTSIKTNHVKKIYVSEKTFEGWIRG